MDSAQSRQNGMFVIGAMLEERQSVRVNISGLIWGLASLGQHKPATAQIISDLELWRSGKVVICDGYWKPDLKSTRELLPARDPKESDPTQFWGDSFVEEGLRKDDAMGPGDESKPIAELARILLAVIDIRGQIARLRAVLAVLGRLIRVIYRLLSEVGALRKLVVVQSDWFDLHGSHPPHLASRPIATSLLTGWLGYSAAR